MEFSVLRFMFFPQRQNSALSFQLVVVVVIVFVVDDADADKLLFVSFHYSSLDSRLESLRPPEFLDVVAGHDCLANLYLTARKG